MTLEPITIDGKPGLVAYFDADFQMVEADDPAVAMAKVVFDDGSRGFYKVSGDEPRAAEYRPDQPRDEAGRWTVVGSTRTKDAGSHTGLSPKAERVIRRALRGDAPEPQTLVFRNESHAGNALAQIGGHFSDDGFLVESNERMPDGSQLALMRNPVSGDFAFVHVAGKEVSFQVGGLDDVTPTVTYIQQQNFGAQQEKLLKTYLERHAVRAFHGTTSAAIDSIAEHGLVPKYAAGADEAVGNAAAGDRPRSIFMAADSRMAFTFGLGVAQARGGHPVLLQIEIPEEARKDLKPDEMMSSYALAVRYEHAIPPEWIKRVGEVVRDPKYKAGGYVKWKPFTPKGAKPRSAATKTGRGPMMLFSVVLADGGDTRAAADWDESKHPRAKDGEFTDAGTGSDKAVSSNENTRKFMARFKDYAPELEAYAKEHGAAALDAEIAGISWSEKGRGMVVDNVSPGFEDMLRKSLDRQRADAKKAKKEAAATVKPKLAKQLFEKYGLKEGDKVTDSESGQPGVVKFDSKGQPFIRTRDYGDVLVGDRWSNKPRTAEFNPDQARDDRGRWTDGGGGASASFGEPLAREGPALIQPGDRVDLAATMRRDGERLFLFDPQSGRLAMGARIWSEGATHAGELTKVMSPKRAVKDYDKFAVHGQMEVTSTGTIEVTVSRVNATYDAPGATSDQVNAVADRLVALGMPKDTVVRVFGGLPEWEPGVEQKTLGEGWPDAFTSRHLAEFDESKHPRDDKGQFAEVGSSSSTTEVGITSARPEGDPGHTPMKVVFARMREFEKNLSILPGVENVRVQPGVGAWQGGSEPTWVVSYKGNGEATKLLAQTAKTYNQDAVLVLKGDGGEGGHSVASEYVFDRGVDGAEREAVHAVLAAEGLGGWTWFKRGGHTVLRAVAVPQWGGDPAAHHAASLKISETLARHGLTHRLLEKPVSVTVLERDKGDYDRLTKTS